MALTCTNFATFAEVEAHYNSIKPLRGSNNAGKDIRPIGDRSRKWERIVKISRNCYALSDGYHMGDAVFPAGYYGTNHNPTLADMKKYAPIVWSKYRDGTERVTLRNGWGPYQHTGRYAFLFRHSPKDLWFRNRNGKHFIRSGQNEYYLAKQRTAPRAIYEAIKNLPSGHRSNPIKKWVRLPDDDSSLIFSNVQGAWVLVWGGHPVPVAPRVYVNKKLKATMKQDIAEFREWAFAMLPLLPENSYEYATRMSDELKEYYAKVYGETLFRWQVRSAFTDTPELTRSIITDSEHPMRMHLMYFLMEDRDQRREYTRSEALAFFNRQINKMCGLNKIAKG